MLSPQDIGLIEPYDRSNHDRFECEAVVNGDQIEIPIVYPNGWQVILLTLGLAAIATPLSLVVYNSFKEIGFDIPTSGFAVSTIWAIAVIGPPAIFYYARNSPLLPNHLLRFDRSTGILSLPSRWASFRREEIVCFLSVTDFRKNRSQTEFQIITGDGSPFAKHLVATCLSRNPDHGFLKVIEQFSGFSGIPSAIAIIQPDGAMEIL